MSLAALALLLAVLLSASAFFSGSETALFSLSQTQLTRLRDRSSRSARALLKLLARPRLLLVTILAGNELVNVGIGIVVASITARLLTGHQATPVLLSLAATLVAFPVLVIFGEVTPKTLAAVRNEQWALVAALPLTFFAMVITPVRYSLRFLANGVIRLLGGQVRPDEQPVSEEAYRRLVDEGSKEGVIGEAERTMIHNVFRFGDTRVGEVMTPAERVFSLPLHWPLPRVRAEVATHTYSRIPVMSGQPQRPVGLLFAKDLVAHGLGPASPVGTRKPRKLQDLLRRALWVPAQMKAADLLDEFRKRRVHLALVADEHGGFAGLATMEDLLEELVGEIVDETDVEPALEDLGPPPGSPAPETAAAAASGGAAEGEDESSVEPHWSSLGAMPGVDALDASAEAEVAAAEPHERDDLGAAPSSAPEAAAQEPPPAQEVAR